MSAFAEFTKTVLWLRKNRIGWNQLTVGNITIDGMDLRPDGGAKDSTPEAPRETITQKYGGVLLAASAEPEDNMSPIVEQDDDD